MEKEVKNYAWPLTAISKEDYSLITNFLDENKESLQSKKLLIFGAGIRGTIIAQLAVNKGYSDIWFTDNNSEKWGGVIDGFPILDTLSVLDHKDEYLTVISAEEGFGIRTQLLQNGFIENEDFFFLRTDLYDKYTKEFKRNKRPRVTFFGDCMFEVVSFDDDNKTSLGEMLKERIGADEAKMLTIHGMSMPAFYHALKGQVNMGLAPEVCVIMINFETLTGKQHLLPRSQHSELIKMICETAPDPDGSIHKYYNVVEERVKNNQADFFTTNRLSSQRESSNDNGIISDKSSKMFLKMNYMYTLNTNMESINYLRHIYDLSKTEGFEIIAFVPPVNYQRGEELFGDLFEEKYSANLRALEGVIHEKGGELLDLSHTCTNDKFANITTPDETTNYVGRSIVANRLVEEIEKVLA